MTVCWERMDPSETMLKVEYSGKLVDLLCSIVISYSNRVSPLLCIICNK